MLVAHSLGGMSITGAADRVPDRIKQLIYIDALIVDNDRTGFDDMDPEIVAERIRQANESSGGTTMKPFTAEHFRVTDAADAAWITRRMTPQPLRSYRDTVKLQNPIGNGIPSAYIASTKPWYKPTEGVRQWVLGETNWAWRELPTGHDSMISEPGLLTQTLLDITQNDSSGSN